jgi:RNA polymerase sigma factor (sigma-70 family)
MEAAGAERELLLGGGAGESDEDLIDRVTEGDAGAFEELFRRHRANVLAVCRRILGPAEAEDAAQQTFLAAYLAIARRGERPGNLGGWLRAVARNECLSQVRRRRASAPLPDELVDRRSAAEDVALRQAEVRGIVDDFGRLPSDQRAALVLSEFGELPHREIAESLECRPGKVKALVYQARATLSRLRAARELPCRRIREYVSRRRVGRPPSRISRHLETCPACAEFARDVRGERRGAALLFPLGAALEWIRSLLGAGGAGAPSAGAAGGAAGGGALTGAALQTGVAKLGVLAVCGGAAVGAGAVGIGSGDDGGRQDPPAAARGANPAIAGAAETGASSDGNGSSSRRTGRDQGREPPFASRGVPPEAAGEHPRRPAGAGSGHSSRAFGPPTDDPAKPVGASDATGAEASRKPPARGSGREPGAGRPTDAGRPAEVPATSHGRPSSAGGVIPGASRPANAAQKPLGDAGCSVSEPAQAAVC